MFRYHYHNLYCPKSCRVNKTEHTNKLYLMQIKSKTGNCKNKIRKVKK